MASWHHWRQKQNSFFLGPQSQALVSVSESQTTAPKIQWREKKARWQHWWQETKLFFSGD